MFVHPRHKPKDDGEIVHRLSENRRCTSSLELLQSQDSVAPAIIAAALIGNNRVKNVTVELKFFRYDEKSFHSFEDWLCENANLTELRIVGEPTNETSVLKRFEESILSKLATKATSLKLRNLRLENIGGTLPSLEKVRRVIEKVLTIRSFSFILTGNPLHFAHLKELIACVAKARIASFETNGNVGDFAFSELFYLPRPKSYPLRSVSLLHSETWRAFDNVEKLSFERFTAMMDSYALAQSHAFLAKLPTLLPNICCLELEIPGANTGLRTKPIALGVFKSMDSLRSIKIRDFSESGGTLDWIWGLRELIRDRLDSVDVTSLWGCSMQHPWYDVERDNPMEVLSVLASSKLQALRMKELCRSTSTSGYSEVLDAFAHMIPKCSRLREVSFLVAGRTITQPRNKQDHDHFISSAPRGLPVYLAQKSFVEAIKKNNTIMECCLDPVSPFLRDDLAVTTKLRQINASKLLSVGHDAASIFPHAFATLVGGYWYDVVFHLLQNKQDLVCPDKKGNNGRHHATRQQSKRRRIVETGDGENSK